MLAGWNRTDSTMQRKGFCPAKTSTLRLCSSLTGCSCRSRRPATCLLAMKLHASRDETDLDDAATLFTLLGYTIAEQAIELLTGTYPPEHLLPRHRYVAHDVAERAAARRAEHGS